MFLKHQIGFNTSPSYAILHRHSPWDHASGIDFQLQVSCSSEFEAVCSTRRLIVGNAWKTMRKGFFLLTPDLVFFDPCVLFQVCYVVESYLTYT